MDQHVTSLSRKMEKAYRTGAGLRLTADELLAMVDVGAAALIHDAATKIAQDRYRMLLDAATTGASGIPRAQTVGTAKGGSLPPMTQEEGKAFIAALSMGA